LRPSPFDNQASMLGVLADAVVPVCGLLDCLLSCSPLSLACAPPPCLPPVCLQAVVPHINLGPFLNRAPITVRLDTPAIRVHAMFVSLSLRCVGAPGPLPRPAIQKQATPALLNSTTCPLRRSCSLSVPPLPSPAFSSLPVPRHIVVVDESNYARGMITRRDLAHAAGSRLSRWAVGGGGRCARQACRWRGS
jgi:hypothetical protein